MTVQQLWTAFWGVLNKEMIRFFRIWIQTLLPSVITTILYFLVFGQIMGKKIGLVAGVPYTVFITPGLIMLAVINNSYSNVVGSFYGVRFNRSVEEMLVSPMPNWLILAGYCMGGVARGLIIGLLVSTVGLQFARFHLAHVWLSLCLIILCSLLFSLAGFLNGVFARNFDDLVIIPTFILTPLIYLGGVFFSINDLPFGWRVVSYLNPVHYLIDCFRYAMLDLAPATGTIAAPLAGIIAFIMVLVGVNLFLMKRGVGLKN